MTRFIGKRSRSCCGDAVCAACDSFWPDGADDFFAEMSFPLYPDDDDHDDGVSPNGCCYGCDCDYDYDYDCASNCDCDCDCDFDFDCDVDVYVLLWS